MKNLTLFAAVLMGTAFASCGNKKAEETAVAEEPVVVETVAEEAVVADTVAADTIVADSIIVTEAVAQ